MVLNSKLFLYLLSCTCICVFTWIIVVFTLTNTSNRHNLLNTITYQISTNKENLDDFKSYSREPSSSFETTTSISMTPSQTKHHTNSLSKINNKIQTNGLAKRLDTEIPTISTKPSKTEHHQNSLWKIHNKIHVENNGLATRLDTETPTKETDNMNEISTASGEDHTWTTPLQQNQKVKKGFAGKVGTGFDVDYEDLSKSEMKKLTRLYKQHQFNAYASDLIPVNRSLPDIRSIRCKDIQYNISNFPQTSVIIVFHNEALSTLLRTIYSVVNRSPDYMLKELILVDDFSTLDELIQPLQSAITHLDKVRMIRTNRHEGLIRARMVGVENSTAPVLTFLDAHVECFQGWLEPLVHRVAEKRDAVVCPNIHSISGKNFQIFIHEEMYVGSFRLTDLIFDWIPVQKADQQLRTSDIDTIRSPAFAGGLFSIEKKYFYDIGSYDIDMDLWGGENIEMSLRIWMCGGTLEKHPCSNVAHLFRQTNPLERSMKEALDRAAIRNNLRMTDVWMGKYGKFYHEPDADKVDMGDTSDRQKLKNSLKCESFDWYIENIYPGLYVPGRAVRLGEIRNTGFSVCIDSGINLLTGHVNAQPCANKTTQFWHLSNLNALQSELGCITFDMSGNDEGGDRCTLERCSGGGDSQTWIYTEERFLYNPYHNRCLCYAKNSAGERFLQVLKCEQSEQFFWTWYNFGLEDSYKDGQ